MANRARADPNIRTEDGFLMMHETLVSLDGLQRNVRIPAPGEIAGWIQSAVSLADRTSAVFDQTLAAVAAREGQAGAQRWIDHHAGLMRARAKRQGTVRAVVLAVIAAIFIVPLVIVALVLLSMLVCSARGMG